jgi:uncharacterized membrane protein YsdA (DUF1294 family)
MQNVLIVVGIIIFLNLLVFILYGIDKRKAKKGKWRIPEKVLLIWSLFGPWGGFSGMKLFHHKTNKKKFTITVPVFMVLHVILIGVLIYLKIQQMMR